MGVNTSRPQSAEQDAQRAAQREAQILALKAEEKRAANAAITSMDKKEFEREKGKQARAAREIKILSQAEISSHSMFIENYKTFNKIINKFLKNDKINKTQKQQNKRKIKSKNKTIKNN